MSDGKYYWLKLKCDFFKRHDIRIIQGMDNGREIVLFYIKLLLESIDHEGALRFSKEKPYTNGKIDGIFIGISVMDQIEIRQIVFFASAEHRSAFVPVKTVDTSIERQLPENHAACQLN